MIPGRLLHRVASAMCSPDMRDRVIDALIADCQHEWRTAATPADRSWVVARCWPSFWIAFPACLAHDMRHDIGGFTKRVLVPFVVRPGVVNPIDGGISCHAGDVFGVSLHPGLGSRLVHICVVDVPGEKGTVNRRNV